MAQLPTSFNAPHSNISDGSDLIRAAMGLNRDINEFGNKAFSTISDFAKQQANQALVNTFANNIANGMDPTSAMSGALGKVNSWTSAEAINNLLAQRNYEQESLRKEALLDIQKAQENRALQDWTGRNEASEANLLLDTGYNTNNSKIYNQGLSKASTLSDIAKKFIKMQNLAEQQDRFATSATSRAYNKALMDNMEDKKLADQMDARFRVLASENSSRPASSIMSQVAKEFSMPYDDSLTLLAQYNTGSGNAVLNEQATNSQLVAQAEDYKKLKDLEAIVSTEPNINKALETKADKQTNLQKNDLESLAKILKNEAKGESESWLDKVLNINPFMLATSYIANAFGKPIPDQIEHKLNKAGFNIKDVLNGNTTNYKELREKAIKADLGDWFDSTFTLSPSGKIVLTNNIASNINKSLSSEMLGNSSRRNIIDQAILNREGSYLNILSQEKNNIYKELQSLNKKAVLTPQEIQRKEELENTLRNAQLSIANQQNKYNQAMYVRYGINDKEQRVLKAVPNVIVGNSLLTKKDIMDNFSLDESDAKEVLERVQDVHKEAKSSSDYSNISYNAIVWAVLSNLEDAGKLTSSDKSYLKSAVQLQDKITSTIDANLLSEKATHNTYLNLTEKANKILNNGSNN